MNIRKVSFGIVTSTLMAGALSGCTETKYEDNAKAQAVKYLNGDQLLKAERFAREQRNYENESGEAIAYWDSLLIEAKVKEAYTKGQQLIRDRANKIFKREEQFKLPLDTIFQSKVIESSKNEYAKLTNAEEFIKARNNAPDDAIWGYIHDNASSAHFWNLITMTAKQKEAYQKGIADATKEIEINK